MSLDQRTELSADEVDDVLGRHETGVLSLARDDEPYAVPISYGYAPDERAIFLRLVSTPDSDKRAFLASAPEARLVVYESEGEVYQSVIAAGTLEEIPRAELTVDHVAQYGDTQPPLFEIWGADKPDLDIQLYRLAPDDLSGRRVAVER